MIGLSFLAVGLIWLVLSWTLSTRLPKWLSITQPIARRTLSTLVLLLLLVGPFADHIVGMWQFDKLCGAETRLWISPSAKQTKRGKGLSESSELLEGYVIPIRRTKKSIVDLDSNEVIARYNYFATRGGRIGPLIRLGGEYNCSVKQQQHIDSKEFAELEGQVHLVYEEAR